MAGLSVIVAGDSLWGCGRSTTAGTASSPDLDRFMTLSKILTGYSDLESGLGSTYLGSQRKHAPQSAALDALYARSGISSAAPPSTLADLRGRGVFSDPSSLAAASQILANWFSGTYAGPSGPVIATWNGALAWKACRFTKPPAMCGGETGYWAKPPA